MGCGASQVIAFGDEEFGKEGSHPDLDEKLKGIFDTPERDRLRSSVLPHGIASDGRCWVILTSHDTLVVVSTKRYHDVQPSQDETNIVSKIPKGSSGLAYNEKAEEILIMDDHSGFTVEEFCGGQLGVTDESQIEFLTQHLEDGELFDDEDFPSDFSTWYNITNIEWKRPHELVAEPKLFIDGVSRRDIIQGKIGNCWFLSSCGAVANQAKLMHRVMPPNQRLFGPDYRGFVICKFWRFGSWETVCIDDRLPTLNNELLFAKCSNENEFWVSLLEKAYAKIHGSYMILEGGQSMDAMVDLTGGLSERYDLEDYPKKTRLFKFLYRSSQNGAFITASRKGDWRNGNKTDENGLVEGHAYTVTGVAVVEHNSDGVVYLIRTRNPWGNSAEWCGPWADGDSKWEGVSAEENRLLLTKDNSDGEVWMSFDDFCREFEEVSMCTTGPDFDRDGTTDHVGLVKTVMSEWEVGRSAGGSRNDLQKFATNPQFLLTIDDTSDESPDLIEGLRLDLDQKEATCQVLISLMQEHRCSKKNVVTPVHQIAFVVYKISNPYERLSAQYFLYNHEIGSSGVYINFREVIKRFELTPGHYVIIPATYHPDTTGTFMIRVYSPKSFSLAQLLDN